MSKLASTRYSISAFNIATLLLRLVFGGMMLKHGYQKLTHFNATAAHMPNLFGIGQTATTALVVFAEFFCALFIMLGLFTRLALIPLIFCMCYALFIAHGKDMLGDGEIAILYLGAYLSLLLLGPGKASVDGMVGK